MRFAERAGLDAAMSGIVAAPQSEAAIDILCCRPDFGERTYPSQITVTRDYGILVERWLTAPGGNCRVGRRTRLYKYQFLQHGFMRRWLLKNKTCCIPTIRSFLIWTALSRICWRELLCCVYRDGVISNDDYILKG